MLRIHFTPEDVARLRVVAQPDPLWETVFSLFRLRWGNGPPVARQWRRQAIEQVDRASLQMLLPLTPGGYFPDFLNPVEASLGLDAGIDALLHTPRQRLHDDLEILAQQEGSLPAWTTSLADGDRATLEQLAQALRTQHRTVVAPYWPEICAHAEADRAKRARAFLDGGIAGLFDSFRPTMRWQPPVLEVDVPHEATLYLDGRGLLMIPSFLSWGAPDTMKDPSLPPVLIYSVQHDLVLSARSRGPGTSLSALIGPTRASILTSIGAGHSTTELARRVGVSAGSISQHTTVLRDAGLIMTSRVGKAVVHTLTPVGSDVLNSNEVAADPRPDRRSSSR